MPFLSYIQEVNKTSHLTSGAAGAESLELISPQSTILYWLGQPNEKSMHDQADSSKPLPNGNPHGGSTLRQHQHRKKIKNSLTTFPPCHVVANNTSRLVTAPLRSDSDILRDDDKPPKSSTKKGNKKGKQYRRATRKKLNLSSEIPCEEKIDAASPVEVLPTDLLTDKLSETSSSASSLVKEAHLGEDNGENNNEYVEHGAMLNVSTLGSDEMDGSECTGSSNETVGERFGCNGAPYLNDGSNTTDYSEFDGSAFTEHGYSYLVEESNSYQKSLCACVYNSNDVTTGSFFNRWNSDNIRNRSVDVEARLTTKDENRCDRLQHGASTGLSNVKKACHLTGAHLSGTCAEDSNGSFGCSSCCSKDVTGSSSHTERVQCSSEACSSKTFLPVSSGRSGRRSRKTSSYSNLTVTNRVVGANRHKHSGKDSSASVWQKVEKPNKENTSRAEHAIASAVQDKSALEDTSKGVQHDPTRPMVKHNQCRKSFKQHSPDETVEVEPAKENGVLNSCRAFSRCIYKKQTPFLYQQTSLSPKKGSSQSSRNYCAPKNGIPKVPKNHSQQKEGLPMLQPVCAKDTNDRSISTSPSANEFSPTGVGNNSPTEGNGSSQSDVEKSALASCNLHSYLPPQAMSKEAWPHKAISKYSDSRNLCADPCAAEMEETQYVKLTTENTPQEYCKLYSAAGHVSQKWVPVGKKDIIHLDVPETSVIEASVPADDISISANIDVERNVSDVSTSTNGADIKSATEVTAKPDSSRQPDLKCQAYIETGTDFNRIREAVSDAYRAEQRVEDIQLLIGRRLADIEQFIYSASPVLYCSPCPTGCNSYSQEWIIDGLCFHQTADISLSKIWQWYEEPGCYGLEVKAQDLGRSKGLWNNHYQFITYFVPYLSAVQLFGKPKRTNIGGIDKEAADMDTRSKTSPCLNSPPILAKLLPQQSNQRDSSSALHTKDDQHLESGELIFEFFESEQPFWRRQLFDK